MLNGKKILENVGRFMLKISAAFTYGAGYAVQTGAIRAFIRGLLA